MTHAYRTCIRAPQICRKFTLSGTGAAPRIEPALRADVRTYTCTCAHAGRRCTCARCVDDVCTRMQMACNQKR